MDIYRLSIKRRVALYTGSSNKFFFLKAHFRHNLVFLTINCFIFHKLSTSFQHFKHCTVLALDCFSCCAAFFIFSLKRPHCISLLFQMVLYLMQLFSKATLSFRMVYSLSLLFYSIRLSLTAASFHLIVFKQFSNAILFQFVISNAYLYHIKGYIV